MKRELEQGCLLLNCGNGKRGRKRESGFGMLSEMEQKEFAKILEFQALEENTIWVIEGEGETLDGMKVVKAMMEGKKVYSVPKI